MLRQHLDRYCPFEPGVPRPVHLAHAARADRRDDLVRSEARSGNQGHGVCGRDPAIIARRAEAIMELWFRTSSGCRRKIERNGQRPIQFLDPGGRERPDERR
jgi:hypothetical protein